MLAEEKHYEVDDDRWYEEDGDEDHEENDKTERHENKNKGQRDPRRLDIFPIILQLQIMANILFWSVPQEFQWA